MKQALNFTGTGVAIVTPFTAKGTIDFPALTKLVEHLIKGRVEYIVVLGTTGETATLSKEEKQLVINTVIKANAKKLLIGHFSSKYESLDDFLAETSAVFPNTELALEGVCYKV